MTRRARPALRRTAVADAQARLARAEEILDAIRAGEVDALVMSGPNGDRLLPLNGGERPYRVLIEAMNEGAVTLSTDGTILYCNRRFAELVRRPHGRVLGAPLRRFVRPVDWPVLDAVLGRARRARAGGEVTLRGARNRATPVYLSIGPLPPDLTEARGMLGVVTDVTERQRAARVRDRLHRRLMVAADDERRRIARELHDETGQSLTAVLVGLRTLADMPTLKKARAVAVRLRELTARTLDDVGRLARGLHPSALDELGLAAAAARQTEEFERSHGIAVTLRTAGLDGRRLPVGLATTVYRLLQEALTNVARHARAKAVRITLRLDGARVALVVQDEGVGFDVEAALREARGRPGGHLGILGMRERATLFGGTLDVRSARGQGTTITVRLPLTERRRASRRRTKGAE